MRDLSTSLVLAILPVLPLVLPSTALESITSNNASLLWAPYRPNHYLGIRPRIPESLLLGLMWGKLDDERNLRHTCNPNDGMAGWGWTTYDARTGGTQTMHDVGNGLDITTEFIKKHDGQSAGNWALRVRGTPRKNGRAGMKTEVVFYVGMEKMLDCHSCKLEAAVEEGGYGDDKIIETVKMNVRHPGLGAAEIRIPNPKGQERDARSSLTNVLENTAVKSVNVTEDGLWQYKSSYLKTLQYGSKLFRKKNVLLPNAPGIGNMHFVQMVFRDNFEFDILYSSKIATKPMTSTQLTSEVESALELFNSKFFSVFLPEPPFNSESHITFSQNVLSNLLGGLSYFHGDAMIDDTQPGRFSENVPFFWKDADKARKHSLPQMKGPLQLLTHVPSRSFFPRGFLWDEGFHLLLVMDWDLDLALEVVRSWLALMDDSGWIPREMILGPEARSNVPKEFIVQYPHIANPPTLFWIVGKYVDMLSGKLNYTGHESIYRTQADQSRSLLDELYPLLKRHYEWFRKSQSGDLEPYKLPHTPPTEAYRWRGRTPQSNLASGLDDYPRTEPPDPTELHLDALCWVGVMASVLSSLASYRDASDDVYTFNQHHKGVAQNLDTVHWSERESMYCDTVVFMTQHTTTCNIGYVTLFPLITGLLGPEHPHLNATLDLLRDPDELWSHYGIRSLSRSSPLYRTADDYWRSPIWININYMVVESLLRLAQQPGPFQTRCKEIYTELRDNLVRTMYVAWKETGFVHEQYNAGTGHGQRTAGFAGWSALIVKIMAFPDLEPEKERHYGFKDRLMEVRGNGHWGTGTLVVGVMLCGFVYVTRRKSARLIRKIVK